MSFCICCGSKTKDKSKEPVCQRCKEAWQGNLNQKKETPMNFHNFKIAVQKQFEKMSHSELFLTSVEKDALWDVYLNSFPEGTNPIFGERTTHDCQCCKQFIRVCGNVVGIVDNKLVSIWDIQTSEHYQVVADALSAFVKSKSIKDVFRHYEKNLGTDFNHQLLESGKSHKWEHFHFKLTEKHVCPKDSIGSILSGKRSGKDVFKRGLEEISIESAETVLELIDQKSIYRGEENKTAIESFIERKKAFDLIETEIEKDNYCWIDSLRTRNTAIGTLLIDISEGKSLDEAVRLFESKVAPENYKRPTALITKSMIASAQKKVAELGIESALGRRYAVTEDITINNVIFADRIVKKSMNVFDELTKETPDNIKNLDKVDEVSIDEFIRDVVPKADTIELLLQNKNSNNLMSLIAPADSDSKSIFKWDNNFSWAYNGEMADSMKERVKKAGGSIDVDFRFSIQWNDEDTPGQSDLDAWCEQPNGNKVYFSAMIDAQTSCQLDVDIRTPGKKIAVENIVIPELEQVHNGNYKVKVHNYSINSGNKGFKAEIECKGHIYSYEYNKELKDNQIIEVAEFEIRKTEEIKFIKALPSTTTTKEVWNINTNKFHKVRMIMSSPNHWDGNKTGNKHCFFILEDCKNKDSSRGFFNEFLKEDLTEHRKVFEVLGSKMKTEKSENQLSGLGFSSTKRNSVLCRVKGSFARTIKINF